MDTTFDTTSLAEHDLWAAVGGLEAAYMGAGTPEPETTRSPQAAPAAAEPALLAVNLDLPVETRALWVTRWDFRTPDDIRWLVDKAAGANFNALYFQVRGNADALYPSALEPWMARLSGGALGEDPGWD
ncbi:MAG TPA: family 10 glycosylhydrolase, partial [Anaerolineae bacterium]|nr:family 10 glycosylhydrolase [Anaerolineae bacterium]